MWDKRLQVCALCFGASLIAGVNAQAEEKRQPPPEGDYDCVIVPHATVKLGSSDEGIIGEILVERDHAVRKGDVVARLESDLQRLNVELAKLRAERDVEIRSSRARLKFRTRAARRQKMLSRNRVVSTKSVDEAETERLLALFGLQAAEADHRRAQLELKNARTILERRTIRSPVDGIVVAVKMAAGEFAHKQAQIMEIAQVDPLNVEVYVPIQQYGRIRTGMLGEVVPEQPVGGKYEAKVEIVDRVFDTASSTFGVRLSLPNPKYRIPAGVKCRIRFRAK
jgi:RND family efflux transporter MFP subunit